MQPLTAHPEPRPARGRWIWRLIGIAVVLLLTLFVVRNIVKPSNDASAVPMHAMPVRTVTITQLGQRYPHVRVILRRADALHVPSVAMHARRGPGNHRDEPSASLP